MIRPGDQLENPVTGEVLIFHETAAESGGEFVRVETIVQCDGFVAAAHVHPAQTERFDILEGTLEFRIGGETVLAGSGDELVVPAGAQVRVADRDDVHLAAEGKTGERGLPGPLRFP